MRDNTLSKPVISLFGSYEPQPGDAPYQFAYEVGKGLAEAGFDVCNGGYDGIMKASAHGAKDAGGRTVGVTCNVFTNYRGMPLEANEYIDEEVSAEDPFSRIRLMMEMSSGYVVLPGGTGTLSEFGNVWEFVAKKLAHPAPIVAVGSFWRPLVEMIGEYRPKHAALIQFADTPAEVIEAMVEQTPGV